MPAHNLGEAVAIADREGKEGVVVRILSDDPSRQMQIKIKQQDYLVLHRLVAGFGEKVVRQAIMSCAATFADLDRVASSGTSLELPEVRAVVEFSDDPVFQNVRDKRREQFDSAIVPAARVAYCIALPAHASPVRTWSCWMPVRSWPVRREPSSTPSKSSGGDQDTGVSGFIELHAKSRFPGLRQVHKPVPDRWRAF